MDSAQLTLLKAFVEYLKKDPQVLHTSELAFFKEWLLSLGAKLPKEKPTASPEPVVSDVDSGASEISESEVEFEDSDILPNVAVVNLEMGDQNIEITEEMIEKADEKCSEAQSKLSEGCFEEAVQLFTEAIQLNPRSALLHARRANCFIKMKKPSYALADCDVAISLNPDAAQPYKWRGVAFKLIGKWEAAYSDLQTSLKLDYSEDAYEAMKEVEPKHKRIFEHNMKYERKRQEKLERQQRKKMHKAREERERARKVPESDVAGDFSDFADFDMDMMKDPEIMNAILEVVTNPSAIDKYKNNPKIMKVVEKFNKCAKGGMPGDMPFGMGSDSKMPKHSCPDLD